jgi:hypothetical protein
MRNGNECVAQKESNTFGVSLATGDALPDIEDVPSENNSLLELLQLPFGTLEPEGEPISDSGA